MNGKPRKTSTQRQARPRALCPQPEQRRPAQDPPLSAHNTTSHNRVPWPTPRGQTAPPPPPRKPSARGPAQPATKKPPCARQRESGKTTNIAQRCGKGHALLAVRGRANVEQLRQAQHAQLRVDGVLVLRSAQQRQRGTRCAPFAAQTQGTPQASTWWAWRDRRRPDNKNRDSPARHL